MRLKISYCCAGTLPRNLTRVVDVVIHIASLVDISQRPGWTGTAGPAHYFQHPIQDQQSLFHQFWSYQYFQNCDHNSENTQRTRWARTARPVHCFQNHKNNICSPFTTFFYHFGTFSFEYWSVYNPIWCVSTNPSPFVWNLSGIIVADFP